MRKEFKETDTHGNRTRGRMTLIETQTQHYTAIYFLLHATYRLREVA